ncbi:hypothetical protein [Bacillus sp. V59.32b]|uniref:hypothetical protein n=1 Tax=Bacillus sp. V59.32b TaxID=1758642 RepID=UPI0020B124C7|nr:hypothetical protein [Bacillus sp. V59.32b]
MSKEFQSYLSTKMKEDDGAQEHAEIISFGAASRWMKIPQADRDMLLNNVFCGHCGDVVTIVDYTIEPDKFGIVLQGKCKNCGHEVARLVEMES